MRLKQAHIYGFGKWVDATIDLSGNSALVLYGENESGKSSLQQFILFMLFSMPPKQRAFYQPKMSGKMGGRLTAEDEHAGMFTIERLDGVRNGAAICYTPDGQTHEEDWLKQRLYGMTLKTYQSVFSFSALDLQGLEKMNEDDVGEMLLGIGLTGSNNIYQIEKRLDSRLGELFKPYGKKPVINRQLEQLDGQLKHLQEVKASLGAYSERQERAEDISAEIEKERAILDTSKKELADLGKKLQALPLVLEYQRQKEHSETFPAHLPFPENGLERLEKLKESVLPLKSEQGVIEDNLRDHQAKAAELALEMTSHSVYEQAQELMKQKEPYLETKKELEKTQKSLQELKTLINAELQQLNVGLSAQDLSKLELPFHLEKAWNELKNASVQLEMDEEQLQQEGNQAKQQHNYLLNQLQEAEDEVLPENNVNELQQKVNEHREQHLLHKLKQESGQKQTEWKQTKADKGRKHQQILIASMILAVLAGAIGMTADYTQVLWIAVLLSAAGVAQWIWGQRDIREMERYLFQRPETSVKKEITEEEKNEAEQLLERHEKKKREAASLEEQMKTAELDWIQLTEKRNGVKEKTARLNSRISKQYETYPFLRQVEIEYWPEFFFALKQLISKERERQQQETILQSLRQAMETPADAINKFAQGMNWEITKQTMSSQYAVLKDFLAEQEELRRKREQYLQLVREGREKVGELTKKIDTYEKEFDALFAIAETKTEEAYYRRADELNEKKQVQERLQELKKQLSAIFPQADWQAFIEQQPNQAELETAREAVQEKIRMTEERLEELRQQQADLHADLRAMESSETHSVAMHRFDMETEQLNKLTEEWAIVKTAREMLAETKRNYRDKYLNKVMEKTSGHFRHLTGNLYETVFAPSGKEGFQAESAEGLRYNVQQLSKGTMDQLYVALRLAVSEIMSEKHRMPFMMDDAFVHFDAARTKRMMQIIEDISSRQQVIIFTSRQEVAAAAHDSVRIQ
ncbi:ATP-binding protein [Lentibacillus sediminis]|uniref:ATP-binding protein n=1 Tax=Lentibacillus sediminis TaxID=1940529 RepID=UPI00130414A3|nr:AAA family ATPase [Lentibacillus sediminis]